MPTLHWFDKTVEYAFVLQNTPHLAHAIPLDGKHERDGDAIFSVDGARWMLIEFKKSKNELASERYKFADPEAAFEALAAIAKGSTFWCMGNNSNIVKY